jgi:hypothetical protein
MRMEIRFGRMENNVKKTLFNIKFLRIWNDNRKEPVISHAESFAMRNPMIPSSHSSWVSGQGKCCVDGCRHSI